MRSIRIRTLAAGTALALSAPLLAVQAAGAQAPAFNCQGLAITLDLSVDTDRFVDGMFLGTEGDDVIFGTEGNDRINGMGGDDVICGAQGIDRIWGGNGKDILNGGGDRDFLYGGANGNRQRPHERRRRRGPDLRRAWQA